MIDSNSGIDWILQQWQFLEATTAQPYLIFLQRDGRRVINSYRRKYPERNFVQVIEKWPRKPRLYLISLWVRK